MKHVIHFTNSFSKIKSILTTSSLRLAYCQEVFSLSDERISSAAHPMVCFSEYDINRLVDESVSYGKYGIAFSNEWVARKRIHPVLYLEKESLPASALAKLLRARQNKEDSKLPDNLRLPIMMIKCFTKNSTGYNSYLKLNDFRFIDENEWRFIPAKREVGNHLISQNLNTYLKNKKGHNKRLIPFPLKFTTDDIKRIFVTKKSEVEIVKNLGFSQRQIELSKWKSRIP